ncbi:MAG TPA: CRISPR-associated RAMP protein Csx7 [Bacillota bacterium]|nr:CRISPR-associated RAMP protein Csx7 [Bacillota bacterium]
MFQKLINAARIKMTLETRGPLLIKAGDATPFDPALPDMYAIRTHRDGVETVFLPGSSLKGVFRSRYESIVNGLLTDNRKCCNVTNQRMACHITREKGSRTKDAITTATKYESSCPACKLFGSTMIAGRIRFTDAYPIGSSVLGHRHGVGIDRITGGSSSKAKYDYEIIEEAKFDVTIWLENYELYQMALLFQVLQDIDDGFVGFGMGTTRGNGHMQVTTCDVILRDYRKELKDWRGYQKEQQGQAVSYQDKSFYNETVAMRRETVIQLLPESSKLITDLKNDLPPKGGA